MSEYCKKKATQIAAFHVKYVLRGIWSSLLLFKMQWAKIANVSGFKFFPWNIDFKSRYPKRWGFIREFKIYI